MRVLSILCVCLLAIAPFEAAGQTERASAKKTIEIQATAKVEVPAEVAAVKVGYTNHAATKDAAYSENVRMSKKIVQALTDEHVPVSAIETHVLGLLRDENEGGKADSAKSARFSAVQTWYVHVTAPDAQRVVDIAVGAGANTVDDVDWDVKDPLALEGQAYAAAIERAKKIAEQTALHSGIKLGEIVSVSNFVNRFASGNGIGANMEMITMNAARASTTIPLVLYAPKIERQASVSVIYAIAQ
jgi:uncharacterized protein